MSTPLDKLRAALRGFTSLGDGKFAACCPAHDDHEPTLNITVQSDKVLLHCFAGCSNEDIVSKLGLEMKDLFEAPPPKKVAKKKRYLGELVATYDYRDKQGTLLYQSCRFRLEDGGKTFKQRHPDPAKKDGWNWKMDDVRRVPYRLPELLAADPAQPVYVVEGEKDVNRLVAAGQVATCNVGGAGNWRDDYSVFLQDRRVVIIADNDSAGLKHAKRVVESVSRVARAVRLIERLPDVPEKGDVSDWMDAGHAVDELNALGVVLKRQLDPIKLLECEAVFQKHLGMGYDIKALRAMLAVMAVERLTGDPVWLLLITGPGGAKTETLLAASSADAIITSTITSEGALLSTTSKKEKAKDATGGLLPRIGERGVLVIKDMTSILSMNNNLRGPVLAGLREAFDGRWERNVGTDGGKSLSWKGRIVVIGAVTTAWDTHHAVIASMGDRFVVLRMQTEDRKEEGRQALRKTGHEDEMRMELAEAVGSVMQGINLKPAPISEADSERLLNAAELVTKARTAVERDYQGNVTMAHDPEHATRFAKQLLQIVRGARAVGMDDEASMTLALRIARDSMARRYHAGP